jgi:hypothetical protein
MLPPKLEPAKRFARNANHSDASGVGAVATQLASAIEADGHTAIFGVIPSVLAAPLSLTLPRKRGGGIGPGAPSLPAPKPLLGPLFPSSAPSDSRTRGFQGFAGVEGGVVDDALEQLLQDSPTMRLGGMPSMRITSPP